MVDLAGGHVYIQNTNSLYQMIALLVVAFEGWFLGWDQLSHGVRLNP